MMIIDIKDIQKNKIPEKIKNKITFQKNLEKKKFRKKHLYIYIS